MIRVTRLEKSFGPVPVLREVTFEVAEGRLASVRTGFYVRILSRQRSALTRIGGIERTRNGRSARCMDAWPDHELHYNHTGWQPDT